MHELNTDIPGAMKWVDEYHDKLAAKFLSSLKKVPSWGKIIDDQVAIYVDGLGNWVRANDSWSFESQRYFGKRGLEVQEDRWVNLLPKQPQDADVVGKPKVGARPTSVAAVLLSALLAVAVYKSDLSIIDSWFHGVLGWVPFV